ncbi:MAG: acyltransferase [Bacilli bacterium]
MLFFPEEIHNFQDNVYFQAINGRIIIGKDVYIAPNVGLINSNHDINKLENHINGSDIVIGNCSWIGMNSVILPGVILGDKTIVGAGSVVTKSFKMGNVIIAGNPAKIIKKINEG